MNKHKISKESYFTLRSHELEEIIKKVYKVSSYECSLEASSDLSKTHTVNKSTEFYLDQSEVLDYIKKGHCNVDQVFYILLDLWKRKEIPSGKYIVDHSW